MQFVLQKVNTMVDMAERFWEKKRQVKDKKDELKVRNTCIQRHPIMICD